MILNMPLEHLRELRTEALLTFEYLKTQQLVVFKGWVCYVFASLFCMSKREHFRNKEKCFLFHFESSFRSLDNQL